MDSYWKIKIFHIVLLVKCVFASIDSPENIILLSNPLDSSVYSVV